MTDKGWCEAEKLTFGGKILSSDNSYKIIENMEIKSYNYVKTYNLTVENNHNFFITDLGLMVHNEDCFNTTLNDIYKKFGDEITDPSLKKEFKETIFMLDELADNDEIIKYINEFNVSFFGIKSSNIDGIKKIIGDANVKVDDALKGVSKADSIIDGLKVVDGKIAGKIPIDDYQELRKLSIHNKEAESITLGKYRPTINVDGTENWKIPGPDSYNMIAKKDNSMYFDMGSAYDDAMKKYNLSYQEMFDYFNVPALDDAASTGKTIRFSHNPELPAYKGSFTELEWKYLQEKYDYLYLREDGGIWYAEK